MPVHQLCTVLRPAKPTQTYEQFHFKSAKAEASSGLLGTERLHQQFIADGIPYSFQCQPALPGHEHDADIDDDLFSPGYFHRSACPSYLDPDD